MRIDWWNKSREEIEIEATMMTQSRDKKKEAELAKLEAIRKFNRENPITTAKPVIVYQSIQEVEPEIDPISYNPAYFVLSYLAPDRKRSKKK